MKSFKNYLNEEKLNYNNWVKPDKASLTHEYKIEYEIKPLKQMTGNAFPTLQSFLDAAKKTGKVVSVSDALDRKIAYRSHTKTKAQIISLIKSYASYPKFRNEKTIDSIFDGFKNNDQMSMPIVLKMPDGSLRIMGGNTRMDIAKQLGVTPKVFQIEVPEAKER